MIFTKYASTEEFADEVTPILMKHEIQNNLFFLNIRSGTAKTADTDLFMATVKNDEGSILLTAVSPRPYPTLLYETDNIQNDDVLEFFAAALVENSMDINLVMTERKLAKRFCAVFGKRAHKSYTKNESLVLYLLESVHHLALADGSFRKADETDMFYLPYWLADFFLVCNLGDYNLKNGIMNTTRLIDDRSIYIWEDGIPVSAAACVRKTPNCAIIGQVYTPPQFRGKGYSTACVSRLSQKLFEDGWKYCALYADCANPYSNKVYQKIGYKEIFYYDQYVLTSLT